MEQTVFEMTLPEGRDGSTAGHGCLVQLYPLAEQTGLVDLHDGPATIGRDPACTFSISHDSVSRHHAVVQRHATGYAVTDQGSTNGTFVNEEPVTRQDLEPGDVIRVGRAVLKFLTSDDVEVRYHDAVHGVMTHDSLTGTHNRRFFDDALLRECHRARRYSRAFALLMLDIDHFKSINDRYGHLVGDQVLRTVCQRVRRVIRDENVLCRLGGEEFAVLVPEATGDDARRVAERIRDVVAACDFDTDEGPVSVTVSVGIATADGDECAPPEELLRAADARLYEAKQAGRDRVCG